MPLDGFDSLYRDADARTEPVSVAVAGGDDPTVLEAMRIACDSGWIRPIVVGPEPRSSDAESTRSLGRLHDPARRRRGDGAVAKVRSGRARAVMKGQIATPALMKAVLDHTGGLRSGRVICQVVLMEIPRDDRRFLLADTGICVQPNLDERIDILRKPIEVADALGAEKPKVALMAATETVKPSMPETVEAESWPGATGRANSPTA